ncbi:retroviral-like aspartic protease family protein [Thermonema rossianum]|uniref:retroviral-like aspartic protease family protein n=1 Tax=Thermonema rossianum TaxID=55505 RepID=UPI0006906F28|nr:retroviral-like aspartic protease family protein [Thermonema rossianum]
MKTKLLVITSFCLMLLCLTGCNDARRSGKRKPRTAQEQPQTTYKPERKASPTSPIQENKDYSEEVSVSPDTTAPVILPIEEEHGVQYIWVTVNGLKLRFVFDTGASNLCISAAEALVLQRQGTLRKEDFLEKRQFQDATGRISEAHVVRLRQVSIGNRTLHDVEALVIENLDAPLLLGQSALQRFGKIEIDNRRKVILLE